MTILTPENQPPFRIKDLFRGIFLAGPSPRSVEVKSWRPDAIKILQKYTSPLSVFVPERTDWNQATYIDQVEWEYEAMENCASIVFWIPREMSTLPGLTTNVEFGRYVKSGRCFYGRPDNSEHNSYLDWLYKKFSQYPIFNNMEEMFDFVMKENGWMLSEYIK